MPTIKQPGRMRVSRVNLLSQLAFTYISADLAAFPAVNLKTPERPLLVWKGTTINESMSWDFGGVLPTMPGGYLLVVFNVNVPGVYGWGNTVSNEVGAPVTFNSPTAEEPMTGRRNIGFWFKTAPIRYLAIFFNYGPTTDGQGAYQCGGIHFGPCLDYPRSLQGDFTATALTPRAFLPAATQAFEDYQDQGVPRVQYSVDRRINVRRGLIGATPTATDDLAKLQLADRQWGGRPAAVMLHDRDPHKAWIMRNTSELSYVRQGLVVRSPITLTETLGP